ncbi:MAG TPA: hypothetical protein VMM92_13365 [Thermoanaerobaculia bacterium]|nr:hypothetical protein [Thermoanaerobaculia bacterium]
MDELNEGIFENEYENEGEQYFGNPYRRGWNQHRQSRWEGPFTEEQELELASELLTVSNEQELEQFLGDIFKKVSQVAGKVINSPVGKALGGLIKPLAKKALPIVGGALGTFVGGPIGTKIGSQAGAALGNILGLELEGLSGEDREFEVAQRIVRLTADAAHQAAQAPAGTPPQQAARAALAAAAARHAPGLLNNLSHPANPAAQPGRPGQAQQGTWVRHRRGILLIGA